MSKIFISLTWLSYSGCGSEFCEGCLPDLLPVASPGDFSKHGNWVLRGDVLTASVSRVPGGNYKASCNSFGRTRISLPLHSIAGASDEVNPDTKGRELDSSSLGEECQGHSAKEHVK